MPKTLYEKHKRNHEDIVLSFDNLLQNLLKSIKKSDTPHIQTNTRLLTFLLGTYAETFLTSFIYESHYKTRKAYFTNDEINKFINIQEQNKRWQYVIKVSIEKKIKKDYENLERVEKLVYDDILNTFNKHIVPIILLRNKIAHGNWTYIINGSDEIIYNGLTTSSALHQENYLSLKQKRTLLIRLKELLVSIISSDKSVYEDYNNAYPNIQNTSREISNISYKKFNEWKKKQQLSYQKAEKYKNKNRRDV